MARRPIAHAPDPRVRLLAVAASLTTGLAVLLAMLGSGRW
jgi:hypothetical protein